MEWKHQPTTATPRPRSSIDLSTLPSFSLSLPLTLTLQKEEPSSSPVRYSALGFLHTPPHSSTSQTAAASSSSKIAAAANTALSTSFVACPFVRSAVAQAVYVLLSLLLHFTAPPSSSDSCSLSESTGCRSACSCRSGSARP